MDYLDKLFVRKLKETLNIDSPNTIPRSGEDGEKVNCYSVYVTDQDGSYLADKVVDYTLIVNQWNEAERTHNLQKELDLTQLEKLNFEINHFHGLVTHTYKSAFEFLSYELSGFYKLQSKYAIWKYTIPKFLHNKRRLKRPDRFKALSAIAKLAEDNHNQTFDSRRLLNQMFGMYTILHPQYPTLNQGVHLVLMSLSESGELEMINSNNFRIKGKTLTSLEHLKEEQAKDKRAIRQATAMKLLTGVLAFTAAFQSGLLKTSYHLDIDNALLWLSNIGHNFVGL